MENSAQFANKSALASNIGGYSGDYKRANNSSSADFTGENIFNSQRVINIEQNKKANFWAETAGILRWVTTFSLAGAVVQIGHLLGAAGSAAGVAEAGIALTGGWGLVALALGAAAISGISMHFASQHARTLAADNDFKLQEYNLQRSAQVTANEVGHAVGEAIENSGSRRWQQFALNSQQQNSEITQSGRLS